MRLLSSACPSVLFHQDSQMPAEPLFDGSFSQAFLMAIACSSFLSTVTLILCFVHYCLFPIRIMFACLLHLGACRPVRFRLWGYRLFSLRLPDRLFIGISPA